MFSGTGCQWFDTKYNGYGYWLFIAFFLATSRRELCITITIHHSCCTTRLPARHVHGTVDIFEFNDKGGPPNSIMLHLPFTCIHIVLSWVIHMYYQGVMRGGGLRNLIYKRKLGVKWLTDGEVEWSLKWLKFGLHEIRAIHYCSADGWIYYEDVRFKKKSQTETKSVDTCN